MRKIAFDIFVETSNNDFGALLDIKKFVGRAPEQTTEFISNFVDPILEDGKQFGSASKIKPTV